MGFMRMVFRRLGSNREHHKAILRNQVTSLIKHERIETTIPKAKELRKIADQMITLAKLGHLSAKRRAAAVIYEKPVLQKLFDELGPRYIARVGGYTRIVRTRFRTSDRAPMAFIEYIDRPGELRAPKPPQMVPGVTPEFLLKRRVNRIIRSNPGTRLLGKEGNNKSSEKSNSKNSAYASDTPTIKPGTPQTHLFHREVGTLPRVYYKTGRKWMNGITTEAMMKMKNIKADKTQGFANPREAVELTNAKDNSKSDSKVSSKADSQAKSAPTSAPPKAPASTSTKTAPKKL